MTESAKPPVLIVKDNKQGVNYVLKPVSLFAIWEYIPSKKKEKEL